LSWFLFKQVSSYSEDIFKGMKLNKFNKIKHKGINQGTERTLSIALRKRLRSKEGRC